ncbi:Npt1/Npt2 family nucleotide transporter [Endozoicomonas lisbonensis]|uniref:Npt1/Npt2 family nucleotide transporter n=1 Tax=Endozoicomonas lisbonensis TaxID=3120522 RepID=UPI0033987CAE
MLPGCLQQHPLFLNHAFMMFLCIINFDILRNLKESLLVTRLGAEVIPFIKLWVVTPSAFLFVFCYSFLANRLSKQYLFVFTIVPFLVVDACFFAVSLP